MSNPMMWFFAVLVVLAMGGVAVIASGRGGAMPPAYDDRPDLRLPDGVLHSGDLRRVRFSLAVRGYRPSEVDALLDRLAGQLDDQGTDPGDVGSANRTDDGARGTDDLA